MSSFEKIEFHAYLRAKRQEKVLDWMYRFQRRLGRKVTLESSERYYKDNAHYSVFFSVPLNEADVSKAIFETIQLAGRLLPKWTITTPYDYSEERWEFTGHGTNEAEGILLITFSIANFESNTEPERIVGKLIPVTEEAACSPC